MTERITLHASQRHSHTEYDGDRRYIRIIVHPTMEDLCTAGERYSGEDLSGAAACFHPASVRIRIDAAGNEVDITDQHFAGVLRLTADRVSTEIVTHEVVHAALCIYRMGVAVDVRLGRGCYDREEILAYIVGDLMSSTSAALYAAGIWP